MLLSVLDTKTDRGWFQSSRMRSLSEDSRSCGRRNFETRSMRPASIHGRTNRFPRRMDHVSASATEEIDSQRPLGRPEQFENRRAAFASGRELLLDVGLPFEPDEFLDLNWRQNLKRALDEMPEMKRVRYRSAPLAGVYLTDTFDGARESGAPAVQRDASLPSFAIIQGSLTLKQHHIVVDVSGPPTAASNIPEFSTGRRTTPARRPAIRSPVPLTVLS